MADTHPSPGHASLAELRDYWRLPSTRAARDRARKLDLTRTGKGFPWLSVWRAEGLHQPPRRHWDALKRPHKTIGDLADVLGCSERNARRVLEKKPNAEFPDPIVFGPHQRCWRAVQLEAWERGDPVPTFRAAAKRKPTVPRQTVSTEGTCSSALPAARSRTPPNCSPTRGFAPYDELGRMSATKHRKRTK
jgi:hypothetical protein